MMVLYPAIKSFAQHRLEVGDGHVLFIQECGNREGIPVLFVHGGPGGGCESYHRRFFNPEKYRVILYDQRGAGKSTPHAELKGNSTQNLVDDIEKIRKHLGIDRWMLFGGSWGSTLSLLYAQMHRDHVMAMILRGIFLCRKKDLTWFYQDGAGRIFPDAWHEYEKIIPKTERDDMIAAYYRRLTGSDEIARMAAAKAWSLWEANCSTLRPSLSVTDHFSEPSVALALARIECHYFMNNCFIDENQILDNADKIRDIPGVIVHGRYDTVCPLDQAYELHHVWESSELHIVRDAGHSASEPGMVDALVRATDDFAKEFGDLA